MCTSYTARYICILSLQYIWISSGSPGVSSRHPGSHPSTPHAVCVCVRTHTHITHTHQPPVKNAKPLSYVFQPFKGRRLEVCGNVDDTKTENTLTVTVHKVQPLL